MGEAKRKKARSRGRSWATGAITVMANDVECFEWSGTRQEAIDLQRRFIDAANIFGASAHSFAKRAAGYLMAFGMPQAGELDRRPSGLGGRWQLNEIEAYKAAVLWLALREHIPNTGQKLEDVFVGKSLGVMFEGDATDILVETARELAGQPFSGEKFQMEVRVLDEDYRLDPRSAVSMTNGELFALAGTLLPPAFIDEPIYVPRIPVDAAEAKAMMGMVTVFVDATDPSQREPRTYAGYTDQELGDGKPSMVIARAGG